MYGHHRNFSLPTTAKRSATPKRSCFGERESQENDQIGPKSQKIRKSATKNFMSPTVSAASKAVVPAKKILAERNESIESPNSNSQLPDTHLHKPSNPEHNRTPNFNENLIGSNGSGTVVTPFHELLSRASSDWEDNDDDDHIASVFTKASSQRPYDPVTNYLSPRPTFLRYRPERRRQFLLLHQESKLEEAEISDVVYRSVPVDTKETTFEDALVGSPASSLQEDAPVKEVGEEINDEEEDEEDGEDEEEEEEEEERWDFRGVCKTVLLGCVLLLCSSYISAMNSPTPSPASQAMASLRDGCSKVQKVIFEAVPWESFEFGNDFLGQREGEEMVGGFVELNERGAIGEKDTVEAEPEGSSRFEFDFQGLRETEEMHGFVEPSHWDFFEGVGEEEIVGGEIKEESSGFGIEFWDQREKEGGFVHPNYRHYLYEGEGVKLEERVDFDGEIKKGIVESEVVFDEVIEIMEFEATEMAENYDTNQASSTNSQEAVEVENKEAVENWDGFGEVEGDSELEIESSEKVSVQVVENLGLGGMESESLHDRQTPRFNLGDHCDEFGDKKDEMKPVEVMFGDANDNLGILEQINLDKPEDGTGLSVGMVNESTESSVLEHTGTESVSTVVLGVSMLFFTAFSSVLGVLYWCRRTAKNSSSLTAKMISETVIEEKNSNPLPIIEREEEAQIEKVVNSFTDYPVPSSANSVEDFSGDTYDDESRAPMVELLGEFMMEEISSPLRITDTVRRMSMTEDEENVSVSRDKKSLRRRGRPSRAQLDMSPSEFSSSMDSPPYGSFTSRKTMVKKEEGRNGETVLTPVRRSSRLRERGVSSR